MPLFVNSAQWQMKQTQNSEQSGAPYKDKVTRLLELVGDDTLLEKMAIKELSTFINSLPKENTTSHAFSTSKNPTADEFIDFLRSEEKYSQFLPQAESKTPNKRVERSADKVLDETLVSLQKMCGKKLSFSDLIFLAKKCSTSLSVQIKKREAQSKASILAWFKTNLPRILENEGLVNEIQKNSGNSAS